MHHRDTNPDDIDIFLDLNLHKEIDKKKLPSPGHITFISQPSSIHSEGRE